MDRVPGHPGAIQLAKPPAVLTYHSALGVELTRLGDLIAARHEHEAALELAIKLGDQFNVAVARYNIAETYEMAGDDTSALEGYLGATAVTPNDLALLDQLLK